MSAAALGYFMSLYAKKLRGSSDVRHYADNTDELSGFLASSMTRVRRPFQAIASHMIMSRDGGKHVY